MKTIHKFIILAFLGFLFMYSFSGCSSSTDTSSTSTDQKTISASDYKIKFLGDVWSSVVFHHKEHADRFGDCYECHYCAGVAGETLWNCRSCHSPGNTEGLCQDDGTHGCIMAQCNYCHEDLGRNPGLDCAGCHTQGALANTGHFVDSPVEGLDYRTNTISGITDAAGTFYFRDGETISFFIEDLPLGTGPAKSDMSPLDLVEGATDVTDPAVTNICRLLLSLDVDGNPDNGITISDDIKNELEGRSINFNQSMEDFGSDPDVLALFDTLNQLGTFTDGDDRCLCSPAEAQDHVTATLLSMNEEPVATNVSVSGYPYVTYTLTGTYVYQDEDGDLESGSIYKWYRYDDDQGANEQEISGATSESYVPTQADVGKYIKFEVTPAAATWKSPGNPVKSDAVGPIEPDPGNLPPAATVLSGIAVSGLANQDANGVYQIADHTIFNGATISVDGALNGKPIYKHEAHDYWIAWNTGCVHRWRISADANKTSELNTEAVNKGTNSYLPPMGAWPDTCGRDAILSRNEGIDGQPFINSTITGNYQYQDAEEDPKDEVATTFQWYRCDSVNGGCQSIDGATDISYILTAPDDVGKFLKFEVTPVAVTGNLQGNPTTSDYAGLGPVICIPEYYTVTGAGTVSCNGDYYFSGFVSDGSPYYKKNGQEFYLLRTYYYDQWMITNSTDTWGTGYYLSQNGSAAVPVEEQYELHWNLIPGTVDPGPTVTASSGCASP